MQDCIPTFTGKGFDPFNPDPDLIDIVDIAHQLAGQTRWNGATNWSGTRNALTIAEHSVRVAIECPDEFKLDGLLHDAAEAYLGDWPRPYKHRFPALVEAENWLHSMIAAKFRARTVIPQAVHVIDDRMQVTEFRDLVNVSKYDRAAWREQMSPMQPFPETIIPGPASEAKLAFLSMFYDLTTGRG